VSGKEAAISAPFRRPRCRIRQCDAPRIWRRPQADQVLGFTVSGCFGDGTVETLATSLDSSAISSAPFWLSPSVPRCVRCTDSTSRIVNTSQSFQVDEPTNLRLVARYRLTGPVRQTARPQTIGWNPRRTSHNSDLSSLTSSPWSK
jgi:hypothetical protein